MKLEDFKMAGAKQSGSQEPLCRRSPSTGTPVDVQDHVWVSLGRIMDASLIQRTLIAMRDHRLLRLHDLANRLDANVIDDIVVNQVTAQALQRPA